MTEELKRFSILKKEFLENKFSKMNNMQRRAVFQMNGPLLILAGAGSGKTTVLINRIAYMVEYGNAYFSEKTPPVDINKAIGILENYIGGNVSGADIENEIARIISDEPPKPWNILAITFTNKAASEIKERLYKSLGETGGDVNASTFHSACARILRRDIERLGYKNNFTVYDTDDCERVIKDVLKESNLNEKVYPPKQILGEISRSKDYLITPEQYARDAGNDFRKSEIAKIYELYQKKLVLSNAVDFDDIIVLTVRLFSEFPDILDYYRRRYKYIMVDEYQDTNHAQYKLVSLLARSHKNICVVGDDDQSIYKFRGATIENILSFEKQFENAVVIKLEQNYRSTKNILNAANMVIEKNKERKGKNLWTENEYGKKIRVIRLSSETEESSLITKTIVENVKNNERYSDHAVLYRMNAQSASVERNFIRTGIPYKIIGGLKFFDRKEIKDITAYMSVINNTNDLIRLKRIVNEPKRGIGPSTIEQVSVISASTGIPAFQIMKDSHTYMNLEKKASHLVAFTDIIEELCKLSISLPMDEFFDMLIEKTGYAEALKTQGPEGENRLENIAELKSVILKYMEENEQPSLNEFLEEIALYTDLEKLNSSDDSVIMMTAHSAKGLEFPHVFIIGMEDGVFPSQRALFENEQLEEERRLAYVAITRAKKGLIMTIAQNRMIFGSTRSYQTSRFIKDIPPELIEFEDTTANTYHVNVNKLRKKSPPAMHVDSVGVETKAKKAEIDYTVGDSVTHMVFGIGTVVAMTQMANDILVEIEFEKSGNKKVMANFAKMKKV